MSTWVSITELEAFYPAITDWNEFSTCGQQQLDLAEAEVVAVLIKYGGITATDSDLSLTKLAIKYWAAEHCNALPTGKEDGWKLLRYLMSGATGRTRNDNEVSAQDPHYSRCDWDDTYSGSATNIFN